MHAAMRSSGVEELESTRMLEGLEHETITGVQTSRRISLRRRGRGRAAAQALVPDLVL